jgi:hypothetical protein
MKRIATLTFALGLTMLTLAHATTPPPAEQVKAEVHGAANLAVRLVALTPASGDVETEAVLLGTVASQSLGEIMGWGADRFDNVDAAAVRALKVHFAAAYRAMQALDAAPGDYSVVTKLAATLTTHFTAIRDAFAVPASAKKELHQMAALSQFHFEELPQSPVTPAGPLGMALATRTLKATQEALAAGLVAFPQIQETVKPQMAELAALLQTPPATLKELCPKAAAALKVIAAATK